MGDEVKRQGEENKRKGEVGVALFFDQEGTEKKVSFHSLPLLLSLSPIYKFPESGSMTSSVPAGWPAPFDNVRSTSVGA